MHLSQIPQGIQKFDIGPRSSASIILVASGHGCSEQDIKKISRGMVLFLPAEAVLSVSTASSEGSLLLFQAMANI